MNDDISEIIDGLILKGAIEINGVDSNTGELLYNFTDKLNDVMPALYKEHLNYVNSEIMYFWEHGFLEIDDFTNDNPKVTLTSKSIVEEEILKLPEDKQASLQEIKRVLRVV
jgi:hypothetical protein